MQGLPLNTTNVFKVFSSLRNFGAFFFQKRHQQKSRGLFMQHEQHTLNMSMNCEETSDRMIHQLSLCS